MLLDNYINFSSTDFKGELAALGAAFLWAVSTVVYGHLGRSYAPIILNLMKGVIAIALLLLTIFLNGTQLPLLNIKALGLLLLSGIIGIALGDTAYFETINCLGVRRALLMETLAPPLVAILALLFLQESLSIGAWCGILLTILGVAWVITERVPGRIASPLNLHKGIGFGLLAAFAQAGGAVLSRAALANTNISPLWAALLRLSAGVLVLLPLTGLLRQKMSRLAKDLPSWQAWQAIIFAAFVGTYLAIWLQQTALKFTAAGIAQTILTTSPLFVLPIVAILGETVSKRAVLGVLVAISGIALLVGLK
ncbi:EamA family transporter [Lyngbya aestuarii]|uniref:EamA family transporter n=1 Tax=Lyngbya aestuarii TaxID=118322 RepID=UPI00403D7B69